MQSNMFVRALCRILIVCLAASTLPAQAGLIGTGAATTGAVSVAGAREAREAIAAQLEALGIASDTARERVGAISDAEALDIAGRIDSAPAGASVPGVTVGILIVVIFLIWRFGFSDQAAAEAKAREGAAQKEAPAKK